MGNPVAASGGHADALPANAPGYSSTHQKRNSVGPERELEPTVRETLESRFGHGFSQVRVHTDPQAADSAARLGAHAYTWRNHVVFGRGQYAPHTAVGRRLLAHELTHVVQQRPEVLHGARNTKTQASSGAAQEAEATRNGVVYSDGGTIAVRERAQPGTLQRSDDPEAAGVQADPVTELQAQLTEQYGIKFDSATAEQAIRERLKAILENKQAPIRRAVSKLSGEQIEIGHLDDELEVEGGIESPAPDPALTPTSPTESRSAREREYEQMFADDLKQYNDMLSSLRPVTWTLGELQTVAKALPYLGPLASGLTIGRFAVSVGTTQQGAWTTRPDTFGEYIPPDTIAMFDRAFSENATKVEALLIDALRSGDLGLSVDAQSLAESELRQLREVPARQPEMVSSVFIHEFAHSLAADPLVEDKFALQTGGYWTFSPGGTVDAFGSKSYRESGLAGAEKPASKNGKRSLKEDLADSILFYLAVPKVLLALAPLRYDFVRTQPEVQELIASTDIYRNHPERHLRTER